MKKAIFITGGASGIGRATAVKFGREGWFVGLGDIDMDGMRATEEMLPGGYSYAQKFDVRARQRYAAWTPPPVQPTLPHVQTSLECRAGKQGAP